MDNKKIMENLKLRGHKSTKIRQALVEILFNADSPLSTTDLLKILSKKGLEPNKSTVYREVDFLQGQKILQEVDFGEGRKRYEIAGSHHHHIICINCQKVVDIPMEKDLDMKEMQIMKKLDFKPIGHSLEFFGVCHNCR